MQRTALYSQVPEASPYAGHSPQLDGIRGLAVLGVIVSHLFPGTPHSLVTRAIGALFQFGATGVDLFFVLSGFLITGILYDTLRDAHFFRKFYARRILRIAPLYYGVLLVYGIVGWTHGISYQGELWSLFLYLQNTNLIAVPISFYKGPLPLTHFWSLAVEEQFYLVWPLLIYLARKRGNLLKICAVSLLVCPLIRLALWMHGAEYIAVHTNTFCRADTLLAGAALALLLRGSLHDNTLRIAPWLTLAIFAAMYSSDTMRTSFDMHVSFWPALQLALRYSFLAGGYMGLIALSFSSRSARRLFQLHPLRSLGKYSYGIYVLHLILFSYIQSPLKNAIASHLTSNKGVGVMLAGIVTFPISFLAAYLSYQLYEKRFLRLKRFFDYRTPKLSSSPRSTVHLA